VPVRWDFTGPVLALVFTDVVEKEEIEAAFTAALSDPRCALGMGLLWDARLSRTPLSADDIAWRLQFVSRLVERGLVKRTAVLVTDQWRATLGYFQAEADRWKPPFRLQMFVDEDEALAWLQAQAEQ
jgi:hypothetical protein